MLEAGARKIPFIAATLYKLAYGSYYDNQSINQWFTQNSNMLLEVCAHLGAYQSVYKHNMQKNSVWRGNNNNNNTSCYA